MQRAFLLMALVAEATLGGALSAPVQAAPVGKATAAFDNTRPNNEETAWGRLVADAARSAGHADVALIDAGSLQHGTLKAGNVEAADIDGLLAFGDDAVVTVTLSGAQLRAALERAARAYPTGSPAFLHCSGLAAAFDPRAPVNHRVTSARFQGREVGGGDSLTVAMPVSLASGATYSAIWNGRSPQRAGVTLRAAVASFIHAHGQVSPDPAARFGPQ